MPRPLSLLAAGAFRRTPRHLMGYVPHGSLTTFRLMRISILWGTEEMVSQKKTKQPEGSPIEKAKSYYKTTAGQRRTQRSGKKRPTLITEQCRLFIPHRSAGNLRRRAARIMCCCCVKMVASTAGAQQRQGTILHKGSQGGGAHRTAQFPVLASGCCTTGQPITRTATAYK